MIVLSLCFHFNNGASEIRKQVSFEVRTTRKLSAH